MIRAIVWKEFREQAMVGLSLLVLGSGLLAAVAAELGEAAAPSTAALGPGDVIHFLGAGLLGTLLLAVTAGMVCGGSLFAAEREAGTMGFLESLPVSRWQLWRAKVIAGSALVVIQVGAVLGVAVGLGLVGTVGWALAVIIYSFLAFCWGMYGSTLARTTLGSVGVAIPAASVAAVVFLVPIMLFFHHPRTLIPRPEGALLFLGLMFTTPLVGSVLAFTRPDRARRADGTAARVRPVVRPIPQDKAAPDAAPPDYVLPVPSQAGVKALLWLATHQLIRPGVILSGFAIVFGASLLSPTLQPVLVWPMFALAAGLFAGVTMFADEQSSGTARFWGEQRLPVGRVWAVKVVVHIGFALWLTFLLTLPSILRATISPGVIQGESALAVLFQSRLFEEQQLGTEGWKYLFVPVGYGFAVGHLCGLLFRKVVVAAGVAGLVGGTAAGLWLPSLLGGGVWHWQLWLPLVVILMTARLILRAWAADRLIARTPVTFLVGGVGLAILVMVAGIGYRWIEVPDDNSGDRDVEYVTTGLIPVENNTGGREFRTAAEHFAQAAGTSGLGGGTERFGTGNRTRMEELTERVLDMGFVGDALDPKRTQDVFAWLTQIYSDAQPGVRQEVIWHQAAISAAHQPTGLFEHPLILSLSTGRMTLENGRRMAIVILAQGLRRQAEHDPAAFLISLQTTLALGRSMRNGSTVIAFYVGTEVTRSAFRATDRWLQDLVGRPDLLREALALILEDDRALPTRLLPDGRVAPAEIPPVDLGIPFDPTPHLLTERYVLREQSKAPSQWLPDQLTPLGEDKVVATSVADLVAFAWSVPWERERTRRLVGLGLEDGGGPKYKSLARGRPGGRMTRANTRPEELTELDRHQRACRRGLALKLAVRLYQAEKGVVPPDLGAVVTAGYLTAIPLDPYDGQPFRYEVAGPDGIVFKPPIPLDSTRLTAPLPPPVVTAGRPGQARVWSVGPNQLDEGGRSLPLVPGNPNGGDDLVFLIPLPPK